MKEKLSFERVTYGSVNVTEEDMLDGYGRRNVEAPEGIITQELWGHYVEYWRDGVLIAMFRVRCWKPKG